MTINYNCNVDIIIPSFNGQKLLAENLPCLLDAISAEKEHVSTKTRITTKVIVVDDGSKDETIAFLNKNFPFLTIIARPKQGGFSVALNEGAANGQGEFVLCLNNDVQVSEDFLIPLIEPFSDPKVFAVTARLLIPNDKLQNKHLQNTPLQDNQLQNNRLQNNKEKERWINESGHAIFWGNFRLKQRRIPHEIMEKINVVAPVSFAPATCVAYRRKIFEELGGFDPLFAPFYWEDVDLSYRALKRGCKILYQPKSTAYHKHSITINRNFAKEYVDAIFWRNLLMLNWKNLTSKKLWVKHLLSIPIECVLAIIGGRRHFLAGALGTLYRLKAIINARKKEKAEIVVDDEDLLKMFLDWEKELVKLSQEV